jgi:ribulose-phosphate 3-epimerase
MIDRADTEALKYADLGVDSITFHLEASSDPKSLITNLRQRGVKAALAIKPKTPVESVFEYLDELDMVLIMTVEPGFGGQSLIQATLDKIPVLRSAIDASGRNVILQVDGGVTLSNIGMISRFGADCAVAGSAVYGSGSAADNISALKLAAANGG